MASLRRLRTVEVVPRHEQTSLRLINILVVVAAVTTLAVLIFGGMTFIRQARTVTAYAHGRETIGQIISIEREYRYRYGEVCRPEVAYTVGGTHYLTTSGLALSSYCRYRVGQQVTVSYQPDSPSSGHAVLPGAWQEVFGRVLLVLVVLPVGFGLVVLWPRLAARRRSTTVADDEA